MVSKKEFAIFDNLRLPLAVLVVYIHVGAQYDFLGAAQYPLLSGHGISNLTVLCIEHLIASLAVPTFFLISGYLFFTRLESWNYSIWKTKMQNRLYSLFIPYIIWNIIACLVFKYPFIDLLSPHSYWDTIQWNLEGTNWYGMDMTCTAPINIPLWFIRDLICTCIISPIIFFVIKKIGIISLLIMFALYFTQTYPNISGLGRDVLLFFSLGAIFAIKNISIYETVKRFRLSIILVTLVMAIVYSVFGYVNSPIIRLTRLTYLISGIASLLVISGMFVEKFNLKVPNITVRSSFLIFAMHIMLVGEIYQFLYNISPGIGLVKFLPAFITSPLITTFVCILVYCMLYKYFPMVAKMLCGRRI